MMKRLSQTLKVALALFMVVFANGTLPTMTAYATKAPASTETSVETDTEEVIENAKQAPKNDKDVTNEQNSEDTPALPVANLAAPQQKPLDTPPACQTTDIYVVSQNANLTAATVTLTNYAALQGKSCTVSLNSYATDGPSWNTSGTQVFLAHDEVKLTPKHPQGTLSVVAPSCYGQTDLYLGSTKYDGKDGALPHYNDSVVPLGLIAHWNGGHKCEEPKKVTICHRTASVTNPYESISVDESSVDGNTGNDHGQGDHYAEHTGPIAPATGADGKWGDIIPPVAGHNGLNYTTLGKFLLANNCEMPAKTDVQVTVSSCEAVTSPTQSVTVSITNPADKTHASVTYTVMLGASSKQITLADGTSGSVVFDGLASGDYMLTVTGTDGTMFTARCPITVDTCGVPVTPPEVIDCDTVFIPKDTEQVHYVESYTGTSRIVTATAQGDYMLDDGDGGLVKSIVFTLDFSDLDCGKGEVTPPVTPPTTPPVTPLPTPMELPHTGSDGINGWIVALVSAVAVYGAVYFAQPKRV